MHAKSPQLLDDIREAAEYILAFTIGVDFDRYEQDLLVRSAVERQFMIVGEAMLRLRRIEPALLAQITDHPKIIGFRNRLAHGYGPEIDDAVVWEAVEASVPKLLGDVRRLVSTVQE